MYNQIKRLRTPLSSTSRNVSHMRAGCSPGPSVIPLALRVNFALGVYLYVKFHVESKKRCCQV